MKSYVLDTSVIIHDPDCFYKFEDNWLYIPYVVLKELDGLKNSSGERGYAARKAQKNLEQLLSTDAHIQVVDCDGHYGLTNDESIVKSGQYGTLVTRDVGMRILAHIRGVPVEDYENTQVKEQYKGYQIIQVDDPWYIDLIYGDHKPEVQQLGITAVENEYIVLQYGESKSAITVCKDGALHCVRTSSAYGLVPKNLQQRLALHALLDDDVKLVTLSGNGGSGKTLLALAAALEQRRNFHQVILTRPIVPLSGKDLGYLPGSVEEKISPYNGPFNDNLAVLREVRKDNASDIDSMKQTEKIKVEAMPYIRGRSFNKMFLIADECFTGDTEVLTPDGYKQFSALEDTDKIAQFTNSGIDFVVPSRVVRQPYNGKLVTISSERFAMTATAGHEMVVNKNGILSKHRFDSPPKGNYNIPTTLPYKVVGEYNALICVVAAIQADGSYGETKTSAGNFSKYWHIKLSRKRKIDRLTTALDSLDIKYTKKPNKRGQTTFYIPMQFEAFFKGDLRCKTFDLSYILSGGYGPSLLQEIQHWDGSVRNSSVVYCSTNKDNIDTIQILAHLYGYTANYGVQHDKRTIFKRTPKPYYRLHISNKHYVSSQLLESGSSNYEGVVYCATVPSGVLLVRQNGKVFVTGNCQNMTKHEIKTIVTRVGEGTKLVITGDINQIDIAGMDEYTNGLSHLVSRMKGQPMFAHITLAKSERSPLAELAAKVL